MPLSLKKFCPNDFFALIITQLCLFLNNRPQAGLGFEEIFVNVEDKFGGHINPTLTENLTGLGVREVEFVAGAGYGDIKQSSFLFAVLFFITHIFAHD